MSYNFISYVHILLKQNLAFEMQIILTLVEKVKLRRFKNPRSRYNNVLYILHAILRILKSTYLRNVNLVSKSL